MPVKRLPWRQDVPFENLCRQEAIGQKVIEIETVQVDEEASDKNEARATSKLDEVYAARYTRAMALGDVFPMIVVALRANGKYMILSGRHRFEAVKRNAVTHLKVYVVDLKSARDWDVFHSLPRVMNGMHGKGVEEDILIKEAVAEVTSRKRSVESAAKLYKIDRSGLQKRIDHDEMAAVLRGHELNPDDLGTITTLHHLKKVQLTSVRVAAGALILANRFTEQLIEALVTEINACDTESGMLAVVKRWADRLADAAGGKSKGKSGSKQGASAVFKMAQDLLNRIKGLDQVIGDKTRLEQFGIKDPDRQLRAQTAVMELYKKLFQLAKNQDNAPIRRQAQ